MTANVTTRAAAMVALALALGWTLVAAESESDEPSVITNDVLDERYGGGAGGGDLPGFAGTWVADFGATEYRLKKMPEFLEGQRAIQVTRAMRILAKVRITIAQDEYVYRRGADVDRFPCTHLDADFHPAGLVCSVESTGQTFELRFEPFPGDGMTFTSTRSSTFDFVVWKRD